MNCADFEERIAGYVGGDLTAEASTAVEQHLRACPECAELTRALEEDSEWLASRPPEAAEVDFVAMRREIRREITRPRLDWKWLAAAAAILLAVGLAASLRRTPAHQHTWRAEAHPTQDASEVGRASARLTATPPRKAIRYAIHKAPELALEKPESPVEIRIATRDPNVTIILLHESKGVSQ